MEDYSLSVKELLKSLWQHRHLLKQSTQRSIVGRYKGAMLGMLWSVINPMFMLAVYTFVFSVVFKAKWQGGGDSKTEFALILFSGLLIFNIFAECINSSPGIILASTNLVKKVIYPLEILPWVTMGGALFNAIVSLLVWLGAYSLLIGIPHLTVLWFPLVLIPLVFFTMGVSYFLCSLGVYLRDIAQVVVVATTAMLFLSPIFYSINDLPRTYQLILHLNPLTKTIEQSRDILLWGQSPNLYILTIQLLFSFSILCLGFAWFQKTRKGFADVM